MKVAIETPVFKGGYLEQCVDSVLAQSSSDWSLWLLWDGGDAQSREILERLERERHPRIHVFFSENRGIARARRFLSEHSEGEWILPLDDDDILPADAVEKFLACARDKPWASLIRARREFIDTAGNIVDEEQWFPFGPRTYELGMVSDIFNQAQPYLIRRSAYAATSGWEGFPDFMGAGEDCDIFLKLEEIGPFELIDETLYHYRLHTGRASETLKPESAFEMWRRLTDMTIARIGLPLERTNDMPPFHFKRLPTPEPTLEMVDFVMPARRGTAGIAAASLARLGVAPDAIHGVDGEGDVTALYNAGFRQTSRPLVCFVDDAVDFGDTGAIAAMLRAMHAHGADVVGPRIVGASGEAVCAAPSFDAVGRPLAVATAGEAPVGDAAWLSARCLLARREVVNAIGGFSAAHVGAALADVDFSLAARNRGFKCVHLGNIDVTLRGARAVQASDEEIAVLHRKWGARRDLLGLA